MTDMTIPQLVDPKDALLKELRWHRNAPDTVQALGSPEALAHARHVLLGGGWKEGVADGIFSMTKGPTDEYARLTVHGVERIAQMQKAGVQIADKPSRSKG